MSKTKKTFYLQPRQEKIIKEMLEGDGYWNMSQIINDAIDLLKSHRNNKDSLRASFDSLESISPDKKEANQKKMITSELKREERARAKRQIELGKMMEHLEDMDGEYDEQSDSVSFKNYSRPYPKSKNIIIGGLKMPRADFMAQVKRYKDEQYEGVTKEEVEQAVAAGLTENS